MKLADTQRHFTEWLQSGSPETAAQFGGSALPGLAIYQNNFRSQLAACLEDSFERTRQWIGADAFHEAVVTHVERVPPSSWTLDAYPRDFPATLALLHPVDPEVTELASLELALAEAFVRPDAPPLAAARLAAVDWESAVIVFTPTLDLQPLTTNAPAIWTALANDQMPPPAERLPVEAALLIWRRDEDPMFRAGDRDERHALMLLRQGMTFADLCTQLVHERGETEGIAFTGAWLGRWLSDGLVTDIRPSGPGGDAAV